MGQFFTKYFPNVVPIWSGDGGVTQAINETLYMTVLTAVVAGILGIVIGILLVLTDEDGLLTNQPILSSINWLTFFGRCHSSSCWQS